MKIGFKKTHAPHLTTSIMNFERFVKDVHFDQLQGFLEKKSLLCSLTGSSTEQWTKLTETEAA